MDAFALSTNEQNFTLQFWSTVKLVTTKTKSEKCRFSAKHNVELEGAVIFLILFSEWKRKLINRVHQWHGERMSPSKMFFFFAECDVKFGFSRICSAFQLVWFIPLDRTQGEVRSFNMICAELVFFLNEKCSHRHSYQARHIFWKIYFLKILQIFPNVREKFCG